MGDYELNFGERFLLVLVIILKVITYPVRWLWWRIKPRHKRQGAKPSLFL